MPESLSSPLSNSVIVSYIALTIGVISAASAPIIASSLSMTGRFISFAESPATFSLSAAASLETLA